MASSSHSSKKVRSRRRVVRRPRTERYSRTKLKASSEGREGGVDNVDVPKFSRWLRGTGVW